MMLQRGPRPSFFMCMKLAFEHLNLTQNPFGRLNHIDHLELAVVELGLLPEQLQQPRIAIQFLADHGRGKTTHLKTLHREFSDAPYQQIHAGMKVEFEQAPIHFVDSIENLTFMQRKTLYQSCQSIAYTTHKNMKFELWRNGFSVISVKVSAHDPQTIQSIFERRINTCRRNDSAVPTISLTDVMWLQQHYKDDIRAMEAHLYELFQTLKTIEPLMLNQRVAA